MHMLSFPRGRESIVKKQWISAFAEMTMLCVLCVLLPLQTFALTIEEPLPDATQEARAKAIFKQLRCVVCTSESINDSNAMLAGDLRKLVRKRIAAGDSDVQVIDYIVSRYGDSVLMSPPVKENTYILWFAPLLLLLVGAGAVVMFVRKESKVV